MPENRVRYTANSVYINKFYQMPKFLFECEEFKDLSNNGKVLSNDAKVLYMLLKDRHELSLSNGWLDDNGFVYLIYTRQDMQEIMNVSKNTITKIVNELKKYNLIEEVKQGVQKPNLIYLLAVSVANTLSPKKWDSRVTKNGSQESQKVGANKTNNNNTYSNNQSIYQEEIAITKDEPIDEMDYEKIVAENIDYENLKETCPKIAEDIYYLMVDTLYSSKTSYVIRGENIIASRVKKRLLDLRSNHICYVIDCYEEAGAVKNIRAYLLTSLYNAPTTINSYYNNQSNQILRGIRNENG